MIKKNKNKLKKMSANDRLQWSQSAEDFVWRPFTHTHNKKREKSERERERVESKKRRNTHALVSSQFLCRLLMVLLQAERKRDISFSCSSGANDRLSNRPSKFTSGAANASPVTKQDTSLKTNDDRRFSASSLLTGRVYNLI